MIVMKWVLVLTTLMQVNIIKTYIFDITFEILINYNNYCLHNGYGIFKPTYKS